MEADLLVHDIDRLYPMTPGISQPFPEITGAAVAFTGDSVSYVGPTQGAPPAKDHLSGEGLVGLPGLIDCHTHAVWAGSRADEFARRLAGEDYTAILEAGGGIRSTVRATRAAASDELVQRARQRLVGMRHRGVTTVEIKSGYGLDPQTERRILLAARQCNDIVRVVPTFLGAHTIPDAFRTDRAGYVRQIIDEQLPLCAPLADNIDVYCDSGAFTLEEAERILAAGAAHGLKIRAHAEQVAYTGIAARAAEMGATSVDHLERLDEADVEALAAHGTVAVMLPGAQLYLRDTTPPVEALRAAGVPMAVATDLNPGTSPIHDLWTAATLACVLQRLTIEEALLGITRHAGMALGRPELGWLGPGSAADLALFAPPPGEPATAASLIQQMGWNAAHIIIQNGQRTL
ncbi:MAG: imidazolonepropionase [Myxococcota bacterium]